jgi:hypothetical protein
MDSYGCVDPRVLLGERDRAGDVVGAVSVADGKDRTDASVVGALDSGFTIRGEVGTVEVSVGIKE